MNDTKKQNLLKKQRALIEWILERGTCSSSAAHSGLIASGYTVSLVTVKRALSDLVKHGILNIVGSGRATAYAVSIVGRTWMAFDTHSYCTIEPDQRHGSRTYDHTFFSELPQELFTEHELHILDAATAVYHERIKGASPALQKKELERLIIELSWKSSKIEGNTYSLMDTEKLILEQKEAPGHDRAEAHMILNHKEAFQFVRAHRAHYQTVTRTNLEELHKILVQDLHIDTGLRKKLVGITGSIYRPLDNVFQITEAIEALSSAVTQMCSPYAKAFLALLGVSYIQPFEDGNKRSARLMANALLLAHGCAPLSYRSIDEDAYREAILVCYELRVMSPLKNLFIEQYMFAAQNYAAR